MVVCLLLLNAVGILAVEQKNKQNKSKLQVIKTSSTETRSYKDTKKEKQRNLYLSSGRIQLTRRRGHFILLCKINK